MSVVAYVKDGKHYCLKHNLPDSEPIGDWDDWCEPGHKEPAELVCETCKITIVSCHERQTW